MQVLKQLILKSTVSLDLRSRMLLYFGGGTIIILILIQLAQLFGLPLWNYQGEYAQQSKRINTETQTIADHQKSLISHWFLERLADLRVLSKQPVIEEVLQQDFRATTDRDKLKEAVQLQLESIRSAYGIYDVIDLIDAKTGLISTSTDADNIGELHILVDFLFPPGGFIWNQKISFIEIHEHAQPVLYIAAAIQPQKAVKPIGAVVFQISTDILLEQLLSSQKSLGTTGEIILIDMQKRLLTPLAHKLKNGSIAEPLQHTMHTKAAEFAAWGVDSLLETKDYRGVDVVSAVRHIRLTEDYAISMILNRDKKALYAPVWDNLLIFIIISLCGVVAVIILIIVVSRQLAAPLEQLSRASLRIQEGELSARVHEVGGLEAEALARAFNAMADKIEQSQTNLQQQVELRTEALQTLSVRQDAILTAVPDILAEIDSDLNYTWTNSTGLSFFGDNVVGHSISDYFIEEQDTARKIQSLFDGSEKLLHIESKQRRFDGTPCVLAWRCKALINDKGTTTAVLSTARDISDRKLAETALRLSEERFRDLLNNIPDLIWLKDKDGIYLSCNSAFERLFDDSNQDILGKTDFDLLRPDQADFVRMHDKNAIDAGKALSNEEWISMPGAEQRTLLYTTKTPMYESNGELIGVLGVGRDITEIKNNEEEKRKLQEQLQQAQKIESVGRLAGGVAHDFNNMLSVILGHAELALAQIPEDDPVFHDLEEIKSASKRSASLTRQLLAFARKQAISPKVLDLGTCVEGMLSMLRRLIGENIELCWEPSIQPEMVKIDPTQIEQLLANLCINAKDAIEDTGKITIVTGRSSFDELYCSEQTEFSPGDYVSLQISDNGVGMSKQTSENIFEPFFTTKELGKGTGLGLATVHGVVKQNKGIINVYSELGVGTTFKIYLPMHQSTEVTKTERKKEKTEAPRGNETILIVEDEPKLLAMATRMLERVGYTVFGATTPELAISLAREHKNELQLLMSDVIMPEMNGRDLAFQISSIVPGIKCLFMSGYTADVIAHHGVLDEGVHFIQKPFSNKELTIKTRSILDMTTET